MRILIATLAGLLTSPALVAEPLFWQANKGALTYYIFGSVHVGDESMYPLPNKVTNKLQESDGLIIEADIRNTQGISYPPITLLSKDVLTNKHKDELKGIATLLELNSDQLLNSPPWAAALAIQMKQIEYLGYQAEKGVDTHLMNKASLRDTQIISLESLQSQIDLLTGQAQSGKELLVSAIEEFDHSEDATRCLIKSWQAGDLDKLIEFSSLTEMSPEFEQSFLIDRNLNWVKQLASPDWSKGNKGSYMMVVGTLHLIGEHSVIELLKQDGFAVKQLSESKQAFCEFQY
ncbi:polysaccharide biosynthesis protein GumN [Vibrio variabilis]|uniref:Polysaccharide biosynthesis protein GumN n=1 Tax=Vibrio variabilis TaxID=990271 RepID=A0ABR4YA93_9VIBR|nr:MULTISPECIES: TraB/GumN family protein [Vibrio]KHA60390.1 polysaccharide biosynthesis protein GumN [Vibrio variabilis]KHT46310.1 polysaccharide biosynthesis protein GumN [Vibrio sinaloensis]